MHFVSNHQGAFKDNNIPEIPMIYMSFRDFSPKGFIIQQKWCFTSRDMDMGPPSNP